MDVLESEHLLQARLANTVAYAAIHANPAADAEKGMANVQKLYGHALDALPYMTAVSAAAEEGLMRERERAVREWRKMQEQADDTTRTARPDSGNRNRR